MNSAHLEMIPPISRKHTFCQPAATPELEAELFPSGSFFPHGNQILDMYCARARPPGSQDSGTMHCPSLGETAMSHTHVLAMLTCMASRSPGAGRYDVQKSAQARPLFSRFASQRHRQTADPVAHIGRKLPTFDTKRNTTLFTWLDGVCLTSGATLPSH